MTVSLMRFLDRWLGAPVCLLLTFILKVRGLFAPYRPLKTQKVLFLKPAEQGSTVLAYRALKLACNRYGQENIYFLLFKKNRFILDLLRVLPQENIIEVNDKGLVPFVSSFFRAMQAVRELKIDTTVDMEFFSRATAVMSILSGAKKRVGLHSYNEEGPYRGDLMTHPLFSNQHLHTSDLFQLMVEAIEFQPQHMPSHFPTDIKLIFGGQKEGDVIKTRYYLPKRDSDYPLASFDEKLQTNFQKRLEKLIGRSVKEYKIILINANCSDIIPLRKWSQDHYLCLSKKLLDDYSDSVILLTGAPDEKEGVERFKGRFQNDRVYNVAGFTSMEELLVLYNFSDLLITNDSGPAHFASLTTVKSIVLFGPETPLLFGSRCSRSNILWAATPFTPCVTALNNRVPPSELNTCMEQIPVDDVYRLSRELLDGDAQVVSDTRSPDTTLFS